MRSSSEFLVSEEKTIRDIRNIMNRENCQATMPSIRKIC